MAPRIPAVIQLSRQIVIVVDMAVRAGVYLAGWRHLVRIGQREARRGVIKIRRQPRNRVMASRACRNRKYRGRRRVLRIRRLLPGGKMATRMPAVRRRNLQIVVVAYVAVHAGHICVAVRERKIDRRGRVVYGGAKPTVKCVARVAGLRELTGYVVRTLRLLKVPHMAGVACS